MAGPVPPEPPGVAEPPVQQGNEQPQRGKKRKRKTVLAHEVSVPHCLPTRTVTDGSELSHIVEAIPSEGPPHLKSQVCRWSAAEVGARFVRKCCLHCGER